VILAAARKTRDLEIKWTLLGDGELKAETEKKAKGLHNVIFEPWIDYKHLPERISKAHILLGIFGTTLKANLVIPNKMFQAMASGRPVITRRSKAYPRAIEDSDTIGWVPAGNPDALASLVRKWLETPAMLKKRGQETRQLFDAFFSKQKLKNQLKVIVQKAIRK
jgi:glycosyltransferase involved in cell wall biosynthesis